MKTTHTFLTAIAAVMLVSVLSAAPALAALVYSDGTFSGIDSSFNNTPVLNAWYTNGEDLPGSFDVIGGRLRTGFGNDAGSVRFQSSSIQLDTSGNVDYALSVDINVRNQLDNDFGLNVNFGAVNPSGGAVAANASFQLIKSVSYFRADDALPDLTTVSYVITGADIVAAGLTPGVDNFLAVRFFHPSNGDGVNRNDIWEVDNLLITTIPEPATATLLALGLLGTVFARRHAAKLSCRRRRLHYSTVATLAAADLENDSTNDSR